MTNFSYTWFIYYEVGSSHVSKIVQPDYDDKLSKVFKKESGQEFFRPSLSGELLFKGEDYTAIKEAALDTKFLITLKYTRGATIVNQYWYGSFFKTDCKFDDDNQSLKVTPKPKDNYEKILNSLDKSFTISELAPATTEVEMYRPPILQTYSPGDTVLTNIVGGTFWESEVANPVTDTALLESHHHFILGFEQYYMSALESLNPDVSGLYSPMSTPVVFNTSFISEDLKFRTELYSYSIVDTDTAHGKTTEDIGSIWDTDGHQWELRNIISTTELAFVSIYQNMQILTNLTHVSGAVHTDDIYLNTHTDGNRRYIVDTENSDEIVFRGNEWPAVEILLTEFWPAEASSYGRCKLNKDSVYTRYITNRSFFSLWPTSALPDDDLVPISRNYKRAKGLEVSTFNYSSDTQTEPTKHGKLPAECTGGTAKYYSEYIDPTYGRGIPVGQHLWGCYSIWFYYNDANKQLELTQPDTFILKHAYSVQSVIESIFTKLELGLTYQADTDHSKFFFEAANPINGNSFFPLMIPKSNVIVGDYDQPATSTKITLREILDMMYSVWRVKWHLEGLKLRTEHISWYQKGGTYTGVPVVEFDLTTLKQRKNNLPWDFVSNKWAYDKMEMPERFEFSWADKQTPAFDGYPINMRSNFVDLGRVTEERVSKFSPDLTLMLAASANTNLDGFALVAAIFEDSKFKTSFEDYTVDQNNYFVQNSLMGWPRLHPDFHTYNLPSSSVNINAEDLELTNNESKFRVQKVDFPTLSDLDPKKLIKTSIGLGSVKEFTVNLQSRNTQIILKHDTE